MPIPAPLVSTQPLSRQHRHSPFISIPSPSLPLRLARRRHLHHDAHAASIRGAPPAEVRRHLRLEQLFEFGHANGTVPEQRRHFAAVVVSFEARGWVSVLSGRRVGAGGRYTPRCYYEYSPVRVDSLHHMPELLVRHFDAAMREGNLQLVDVDLAVSVLVHLLE